MTIYESNQFLSTDQETDRGLLAKGLDRAGIIALSSGTAALSGALDTPVVIARHLAGFEVPTWPEHHIPLIGVNIEPIVGDEVLSVAPEIGPAWEDSFPLAA